MQLLIGLTTVETKAEAIELAKQPVDNGWAACVQIDGPITSIYNWNGKVEVSEEFRLMFKFTAKFKKEMEHYISENHPFSTPQWIVLRPEDVTPTYLKWVMEVTG
jgi:periplasmic divalent cation tolerance protein